MSEMEVTEGQLLSQDFGVGGPPAAVGTAEVSQRPIELITQDIRTHQMAFQYHVRMMLSEAIELGRYLEEAKAALPHGRWGAYLKDEIGLAPSTAQNFMRVFREYGDAQQSLFGGTPKSQTYGNLTYSQALRLLAIPDEEERERFAVENDVEHMSVRELNEALKARDQAEEKAAAARDEADRLEKRNTYLQGQLTDQANVYKAKLTAADVETTEARREARETREALEKQQEKAKRLQEALSEANTSVQAAEEEHTRLAQELEELRNRPSEADTAAVEAARQAAIAEMTEEVEKAKTRAEKDKEKLKAAEEALEATQRELADLKAKEPEVRELTQEEKDALIAGAVERAKAEGVERIRTLEKQLVSADPNVAEFGVRLKSIQKEYWEMREILDRIAQTNEAQAARCREALEAALEQMATS
ncbi:MAG: DUF3102 domain-containing protein [Oscillospiraceae bacterium]|nr:DUF3102 domain-containing protein [Oscillospiraceae bacterium]